MNISAISPLCLGLLLSLTLCLVNTAHADDAHSVDQLADQIRKTDEQLQALKRKIDNNTTLKHDLETAFRAAQDKTQERNERLQELDTRIEQFNTRLIELEDEVKQASYNIDQHKSTLAQALRSAQDPSGAGGLKTLLQHDNPAHAQRLQVYRNYYFEAQQQKVESAMVFLERVEQAHLKTLKDRNWLNHIRSKANAQRNSHQQIAQSAHKKIEDVSDELQRNTQTAAELEQDQQRLQTLMLELEQMKRGGSGYFASQQGNFDLPVSGTVRAYFGEPKTIGKLRWNGLFIEAEHGAAVRAVADGEVVYSDWLQGFGMLVIIDHGDGYMTLYGGNRTVMPIKGTWVESGSTIASVGDSGGQHTSGLYFEIRHNATVLDPQEWLKPATNQ